MQQWLEPVKLFTAKGATGTTVAFPIQDWQHVFLQAATSGSGNMTIKVQISNSYTAPDFSSAASISNPRTYVQVKDLITNTAIDGGTGLVWTGTDGVKNVEINTNGQRWIAATITAISAGAVDLVLTAKNNQ